MSLTEKSNLFHVRLYICHLCTLYNSYFEFAKLVYIFSYAAPSSPPLNFVATPTDSRSIALHWDPPLPEDRNGPITSYLVNVTVIETGEMFEINTTLTTFRLFFLTPFTTYEFVIAASTEVGLGPFSETVSVLTPEDGERLSKLMLEMFCQPVLHILYYIPLNLPRPIPSFAIWKSWEWAWG